VRREASDSIRALDSTIRKEEKRKFKQIHKLLLDVWYVVVYVFYMHVINVDGIPRVPNVCTMTSTVTTKPTHQLKCVPGPGMSRSRTDSAPVVGQPCSLPVVAAIIVIVVSFWVTGGELFGNASLFELCRKCSRSSGESLPASERRFTFHGAADVRMMAWRGCGGMSRPLRVPRSLKFAYGVPPDGKRISTTCML
jgi:hypothetical protein